MLIILYIIEFFIVYYIIIYNRYRIKSIRYFLLYTVLVRTYKVSDEKSLFFPTQLAYYLNIKNEM